MNYVCCYVCNFWSNKNEFVYDLGVNEEFEVYCWWNNNFNCLLFVFFVL